MPEPCDTTDGPCACGAWHTPNEPLPFDANRRIAELEAEAAALRKQLAMHRVLATHATTFAKLATRDDDAEAHRLARERAEEIIVLRATLDGLLARVMHVRDDEGGESVILRSDLDANLAALAAARAALGSERATARPERAAEQVGRLRVLIARVPCQIVSGTSTVESPCDGVCAACKLRAEAGVLRDRSVAGRETP